MNIQIRFWTVVAALMTFQAFAAPIQFEDTSDKLGFTRGTETWGIAWGNLNTDKYPDLWNSAHRDFPRLYRNTGTGDFDDVAMWYDRNQDGYWIANTKRDVHGGSWADYDNDGDDDLITGDEQELFINQATDGGFFSVDHMEALHQNAFWNNTNSDRALESDVSCTFRPAGAARSAQYILLFDVDVDGSMDKICAGEGPFPYSVSNFDSNLIPTIGLVNDTALGDFNNDLRTDMVMTRGAARPSGAAKVNEQRIDSWLRTGGRGFTFSALGEVRFLIDGDRVGVFKEADEFILNSNGNNNGIARGISISYDDNTELWSVEQNSSHQGYVRIIAQNTLSEPVMFGLSSSDLPIASSHGVNTPSGFEWVTNTGLSDAKSCISVVAADFDNDMDLDLYMACRQGVSNLANRYFDNDGLGTFTEVFLHGGEGPVGAGIDFGVADSVISADYDVDGFMDLAISNGALFHPVSLGGPDTLIRNTGNTNHWVQLDLIGTVSPRAAIGAKVYVTAGGITQLREQSGGYHRWSQNHSRIHVGLADNTNIDQIRVEWPSGQIDTFNNVAADQLYDVTERTNIVPAVLGDTTTVTFEPGEECGQPVYTSTLGPALLVWRECGTDDWRLRAKGGLGRLTEARDLTLSGSLEGTGGNFGPVSGVTIDPSDILDNSVRSDIAFELTVQQNKTNSKGINFNTNGQTGTCLMLDSSSTDFETIYLGNTGKRIDLPYDLSGLGSCSSNINNLATNKYVTQSSTRLNAIAERAIDGNTSGVYNDSSTTHTNNEYSPWWEIDLGDVYSLDTINLWNRTDCCNDRLADFDVLISDTPFISNDLNAIRAQTDVTSINYPDIAPVKTSFNVNRTGRYVRVQLVGQSALSLAEVEVMGRAVNPGGESCSEPDYDSTTEQAVFLWQDCSTGQWHVRLAGGGDASGVLAVGEVLSTTGFDEVTGFSIEANDTLDYSTNPQQIMYNLRVWNAAEDGFGFTPSGSDACFTLESDVPLYLGENKVAVTSPLNLDTLESCSVPVEPEACGEPVFDKATEPGLFVWKDCSASGADEVWHMLVAGGGLSWSPYSGLLTSSNLVTATGTQLEANDVLDAIPGDTGLNFTLNVANKALDGIDFSFPTGGQTCFDIQQLPSSAEIYVGRNKLLRNNAFNLEDLGVCL